MSSIDSAGAAARPNEDTDKVIEDSMDEQIGKYNQSKPVPTYGASSQIAGPTSATSASAMSSLREDELSAGVNSFFLWLARYPVEKNHPRATTDTIPIWKSADVMTVQCDEKIPAVLKKLTVEGFLGAPVLSPQHKFIGFIELLDIVWHLLKSFGAWRKEQGQTDNVKHGYWENFLELDRFRNTTVGDVMIRPNKSQITTPFVYQGFSLFTVIEFMGRVGLHRVAVIDGEQRIVGLITQSMVISLFDQHLHRFADIRTETVENMMPHLTRNLQCVDENANTVEAFKKMVRFNLNGLAVVSSSGELVDTISIRDLRGIGPNAQHFERMYLPIKAFKAEVRKEFSQQTPANVLFVTAEDTFEKVVKLMDDGNIHRIFVCKLNANGRPVPVSVIAQRDVLKYLLHRIGLPCVTDMQTAMDTDEDLFFDTNIDIDIPMPSMQQQQQDTTNASTSSSTPKEMTTKLAFEKSVD